MIAPSFDATITLFSHHLAGSRLQGLPNWAVVEAVGRAARAVPGAGYVDVEDGGGALPEPLHRRSPLDQLYATGTSTVQDGPEWDALRRRIGAAIAGALAGEEPEEPRPQVVHPAPAGLRRWFRSQREA